MRDYEKQEKPNYLGILLVVLVLLLVVGVMAVGIIEGTQ